MKGQTSTASEMSILPHTHTITFLTLEQREKRAINEAFSVTNCSVTESSKLLGISRPSLYRKVANHSLSSMLPRKGKI
jgi:transcriptional regulator of acetoin/glycerol metabolism